MASIMVQDNATVDDATCNGYNPYDHYSAPLLPTPPNSADPYSLIFLHSPPPTSTANKRKSHYQTFSQSQLLTPPDSAGLLPEHSQDHSRPGKLHRRRSFLPLPKSHSLSRPVSMGFITSKKDKEKVKEEKKEKSSKSKEKGKEREKKEKKKSEDVLHVDEHADSTISRSKFSCPKSSSSSAVSTIKLPKDKSLKKKRSVARLLMLAATDPPPTVILPPSPNHRLHIFPVSTTEAVSLPYEEKPGPLVVPVVLNDEESGEEEGRYTYAVEHRDSMFSTKFRMKNRWSLQHGMRMHPHGNDAVYMQSYEHMSMENDRHFNTLLRRLNSNGTPSFHDYARLGESPPSCVLDMACGQGFWLLQAATQWPNSRIVGLDLMDVRLPQVKARENIEFIGGNFLHYTLPFPSNSFDYVRIANASLAIPFDKWKFVLKEVERVLTRGGRLEVIDDQIIYPYASHEQGHPSSLLPAAGSAFELDDDDNLEAETVYHQSTPGDADVSDRNHENRKRASSLVHGPRPSIRPMTMSAGSWKRMLGYDGNSGTLVTPPLSDEDEEAEVELQPSSPDDSSSSDEEDYGQEIEVKLPFEGALVPSPNVLGPRPNARPMSMDGTKWKHRLSFSLWKGENSSSSEGTSSSDDLTTAINAHNRISTSSTTSSSGSSCSTFSSAHTASTSASSVEDDAKVSTRPPVPIRPLPLTPPSSEEETVSSSPPAVIIDDCDFVSSPEKDGSDDDLFPAPYDNNPPTPMTSGTIKPPFERDPLDEAADWHAHERHSQELESVFTDMLRNRYGVDPEPGVFLASAMEKVFGVGKAGRVSSMHLMVAPEEFGEYVDGTDGDMNPNSKKEKERKKGSVRWSDEQLKDDEKQQRTRALTESSISRNSTDSTGSLNLPPGMSAKAALKLGITYSALADATAESARSRNSVISMASTSSGGEKKTKQSPGLLLWPSTLIPMSPAELEMHACKNMHDLLGCKPALAEWVSGYVDENGERVVSDEEFEETMWEYECFRRKRLNWPENLPETDMDAKTAYSPLFTLTRNIEIPTSPRTIQSPSHSKTMSQGSVGTPFPSACQELAGGVFSKEDLTHVRTIRVYEAVKSWRPRPLSQDSEDNNKTPTSASPV
ncbi:hypothetical protein AAF712_006356 [Marasmius tenuissimus]|uniref:Methyltransferase domain-containing protein n=1 Tax=Marasmius tenuissimus TaxID=585030 RepID=A0ABR2ZYV0_9AGAR